MNAQAWAYQLRPIWFVRMDAGRPSEAKNCVPLRVAVMRPARKDSASLTQLLATTWIERDANWANRMAASHTTTNASKGCSEYKITNLGRK